MGPQIKSKHITEIGLLRARPLILEDIGPNPLPSDLRSLESGINHDKIVIKLNKVDRSWGGRDTGSDLMVLWGLETRLQKRFKMKREA